MKAIRDGVDGLIACPGIDENGKRCRTTIETISGFKRHYKSKHVESEWLK